MLEVGEFRARVRHWLRGNAERFCTDGSGDLLAARAFRAALWDAGLLGLTLETKYGGQGLTAEHQKAFDEEVARYQLPPIGEAVTTGICAPTLLEFGTRDQIRSHVPRMIRGDEVWTQLLSEPGAGSDLAGVQTKAIRDGDEYIISGQKVWTSSAHCADLALCVARTNPHVPKHHGLSMFIVDLNAAGVDVRPLRQMTGEATFNEVFLDAVRVPASDLVGLENDGWQVLMAMLTHERLALGAATGAGGSGQNATPPSSDRFIALARLRGLDNDPVIRQELAKLYTNEKALAYLGQRMRDEIAAGLPVGPKGSIAKLAAALLARQSAGLGMALGGAASQAWDPEDSAGSTLAMGVLAAPAIAIAGGTSEIQRNTVGERVLGLPREPQVDRDVPFKDVPHNTLRRNGDAVPTMSMTTD